MIRLLAAATLVLTSLAHADSPSKILRYPDIHGDRIAFVHAGDIYVAAASGGTAQHLTWHEGTELYPKFSPDGKWIAFSAEYNGTRQLVKIDVEGFSARVQPLKAPAGNYSRLEANATGVFVISDDGRNGPQSLQTIALEEDNDKLKKVADDVEAYALSANGKKLLLRRKESFSIVDAAPEANFDKGKLALDTWEIRIEPRREWRQMFVDA